ncbi:uncharacterized protein V1510DRAFT_133918 [Dipodascopsis tothii]|uniref:uncharacterized protein n=1 Tax=Dipodascopsis tothii TaxID=44089 RepID=UPI0034CD1492
MTMSGTIQRIDDSSVDRIASAQVVVDLTTAVKELVENSVDAHATSIDVRFRQNGLEAFEVADNGDGIAESDFDGVGLRHHTSKLRTFEDVATVSTFGFRGEAVSSLCAVSAGVQITTCTAATAPRATRLTYDQAGRLTARTPTAGKQGTTVTVSRLFDGRLPVRRKEFEKNAKREFGRCVALLQAYALLRLGVRFSVSNQTAAGKRTVLFATTGGKTVGQNVTSLFGAKAFAELMEIDVSATVEAHRSVVVARASDEKSARLVGYVSRPVFGYGRAASDRQILYVNGRPVNLPQISRCVNEVYRTYNSVQFPMIVADLQLPLGSFDVNVSPDKRTILLHDEAELIEGLRDGLVALFDQVTDSIPLAESQALLAPGHERPAGRLVSRLSGYAEPAEPASDSESESESGQDVPSSLRTRLGRRAPESSSPVPTESPRAERVSASTLAQLRRRQAAAEPRTVSLRSFARHDLSSGSEDEAANATGWTRSRPPSRPEAEAHSPEVESSKAELIEADTDAGADADPKSETEAEAEAEAELEPESEPDFEPESEPESEPGPESNSGPEYEPESEWDQEHAHEHTHEHADAHRTPSDTLMTDAESFLDTSLPPTSPSVQASPAPPSTPTPSRIGSNPTPPTSVLPTSSLDLASLEAKAKRFYTHDLHTRISVGLEQTRALMQAQARPRKRAAVDDGDDDGEQKLERLEISKRDFKHMRIVGQFNLGFIIALRPLAAGRKDLFIIDQHASDEKYNFERYQRETVIQRQPVVVPQRLDLTAVEELVVSTHRDLFEDNGFGVAVDETAPVGARVAITAFPQSKATSFTSADFMELVHMINEAPGLRNVRCSKLRAMHAMRACRSSVMIGKPLARDRMKRIVEHLGDMDKPWNCPHGRPTMRHLVDTEGVAGWTLDL